MSPEELLRHADSGQLWPDSIDARAFGDLAQAYQSALALRALRIRRGEVPRGFKLGFTNRRIWPIYQVFAPIWGTVWDTSAQFCDGEASLSLERLCQPRIEPEVVFGIRATPKAGANIDELFAVLDWVAPGFELVQSHRPGWKFTAPETVADGGLHGKLLVGPRTPIARLAGSAAQLQDLLAREEVALYRDAVLVERGSGANVLGDPLQALLHFLNELRQCPNAPDLRSGDIVTTGTWTDAQPMAPGQRWHTEFSSALPGLALRTL